MNDNREISEALKPFMDQFQAMMVRVRSERERYFVASMMLEEMRAEFPDHPDLVADIDLVLQRLSRIEVARGRWRR